MYIVDLYYQKKEFLIHCSLYFLHIKAVSIMHFPQIYFLHLEIFLMVLFTLQCPIWHVLHWWESVVDLDNVPFVFVLDVGCSRSSWHHVLQLTVVKILVSRYFLLPYKMQAFLPAKSRKVIYKTLVVYFLVIWSVMSIANLVLL